MIRGYFLSCFVFVFCLWALLGASRPVFADLVINPYPKQTQAAAQDKPLSITEPAQGNFTFTFEKQPAEPVPQASKQGVMIEALSEDELVYEPYSAQISNQNGAALREAHSKNEILAADIQALKNKTAQLESDNQALKAKLETVETPALAPAPLVQQSPEAPPASVPFSVEAYYQRFAHKKPPVTALPAPVQARMSEASWLAARGMSLRNILGQWSRQAGVELFWDTGADFTALASLEIQGSSYEAAVEALLAQYEPGRMRPVGSLYIDPETQGRVLVIQALD